MEINKTLIIPLRNESEEVIGVLSRFEEFIKSDTEFLVVLDSEEDQTYEILNQSKLDVKILVSEYPPGACNAIKYGVDKSSGKSICIAMGDGSDDPRQVEDLLLLVERGLAVAVASRYSRGGQFVGNKNFKYFLSKYSGLFLYLFFRIGTKDPTNMFKAYDKEFLNEVNIQSENGFTLGLEMTIKAKLHGYKIGEIPTIWIDRSFGKSKFNFRKFLPSYIHWALKLIFRSK